MHFGVRFQAVPVADPMLGGPAECAPQYKASVAPITPGFCLVWWPDASVPRGTWRDCPAFLEEGDAFGTVELDRHRELVYWMLPAGRTAPVVIPTGPDRKHGARPIRLERAAGQLYVAEIRHWPYYFDYSWVEDGVVIRKQGRYRGRSIYYPPVPVAG